MHNREVLNNPKPLIDVPMEKIISDTYNLEGYGLIPDKVNELTMMPEEPKINLEMEKIFESIKAMEKVCSNLKVQSADKSAILTIACCPWQGNSFTMTHEQLKTYLGDFQRSYDKEAFNFQVALKLMLRSSLTPCYLDTLSKIHKIPNLDTVIEDLLQKFWLDYSDKREISQLVDEFGIVLIVIAGCKENPVQCITGKIVCFDEPIIIGQSGDGFHKTMMLQSSKMSSSTLKTSRCQCGRKNKHGDKANCLSCACVLNKVPCNAPPWCGCTNCENQYGEETFKMDPCKCKAGNCTTNHCLCVKGKKSCKESPQ